MLKLCCPLRLRSLSLILVLAVLCDRLQLLLNKLMLTLLGDEPLCHLLLALITLLVLLLLGALLLLVLIVLMRLLLLNALLLLVLIVLSGLLLLSEVNTDIANQ